ncbi:uncharacterized protein O3C94_015043 [Discoglossus pictus]
MMEEVVSLEVPCAPNCEDDEVCLLSVDFVGDCASMDIEAQNGLEASCSADLLNDKAVQTCDCMQAPPPPTSSCNIFVFIMCTIIVMMLLLFTVQLIYTLYFCVMHDKIIQNLSQRLDTQQFELYWLRLIASQLRNGTNA